MDIQARKIEFIKGFLNIQDDFEISKFELLLEKIQMKPKVFTVDELNKRIDKAEKDFSEGKFKTSKELLAKYQ